MLTFWALLEEPDIESYVGTLLLPSYMSYLRRSPIRFAEQPLTDDPQQPIILTYTGDGRMEEFAVHPKKHAVGLLQSVVSQLDAQTVRIVEDEPIWKWSVDYRNEFTEFDPTAGPAMRLYFEPICLTLPVVFPERFDAKICYVSVSRRELFIGLPVLQAFCGAWIDHLERKSNRDRHEHPVVKTVSGGIVFQGDRIGGEFLLEDDEPFRNLLRFTGLDRSLKEIAEIAVLDWERSETDIDDDGVRFRLISETA